MDALSQAASDRYQSQEQDLQGVNSLFHVDLGLWRVVLLESPSEL